MANRSWNATREAVKLAGPAINGTSLNPAIDRLIESATRSFEDDTGCFFVPRTLTKTYDSSGVDSLWLPDYLLSVTTLKTDAGEDGTYETTISASDYWLWPDNETRKLRVDLKTGSFPSGRNTIQIVGLYGRTNDTEAAGTLVSGLSSGTTATSMVCSNGSLVGVGDCLLIESEQVFVTDKTSSTLGVTVASSALTASITNTTVVVSGAPTTAVSVGEVLRIESEYMRVKAINSTTSFEVERAFDGTALAAHNTGVTVFIFRTLTIERGVNGTTAATHADATAMTRYVVPSDVEALCVAEVISKLQQEAAGWGRSSGAGENQREFAGGDLQAQREQVIGRYRRWVVG